MIKKLAQTLKNGHVKWFKIMFFISLIFMFFIFKNRSQPVVIPTKRCSMLYLENRDRQETVPFWGIVEAKRSTPVVAQTDGVIDLLVLAGDRVTKGATIFKLRNLEYEKAYELAKNAVEIAKQQYDRALTLAHSKTISKSTLEEKENIYIQEQQRLAKAAFDFETILFKAPFDGVVGTFKVQEGSFVKTGDVVSTFYDSSELVVRFSVPICYRKALLKYPIVYINENKHIVNHIPALVNPNTQSLDLTVNLKESPYLSGEVVEVKIISQSYENALIIPMNAVRYSNDIAWVLLLKDGRLTKQSIELGNDQGLVIKGLKAGDSICLDPHNFHEFERVKPDYGQL